MLEKIRPTAQEPDSLEEIINKRADFLEEYQDRSYAKKYRDFVEVVQQAEAQLGKKRDLTNAVARNLFKLMSYKDEYEVARLYTNGEFEKHVTDTFEGDFKLKYHLAPPLIDFSRKPNGRPVKREFGSWTFRLFQVLARLKRLRGGPLDIFGYTKERKTERQLIVDYRAQIEDLLPKLSDKNNYDNGIPIFVQSLIN